MAVIVAFFGIAMTAVTIDNAAMRMSDTEYQK
jgi:hypothetical protein